jgi:recombination protein RecT
MASPSNQISIQSKARQALEPIFKDKSVTGRYSRAKMDKGIQWEVEKNFALQLMERNEKLAITAGTNPLSFANAMVDMAVIGVSLSPTLGHAYLIPENINGVATIVSLISYKGLENLALKSKTVLSINTELVYSKDSFSRGTNETGAYVVFEMARGERGFLEGGFCRAKMANGETHVEWMTADELQGCHEAATAKQGKEPFTWKGKFQNEMRKKCVVRRAAKHWVLPSKFMLALKAMDEADPMDFSQPHEPAKATAVTLISQAHINAIREDLVNAGVLPSAVDHWLASKAKAMGYHNGLDSYPDEEWTALRDSLLDRQAKVKEKRANEAKPKTTGEAPAGMSTGNMSV